jgi:hypothetical protein
LPNFKTPDAGVDRPNQAQLAQGVAWLREERTRLGLTMEGYDVVMEGNTSPGDEAVAEVREWERAGATWWLRRTGRWPRSRRSSSAGNAYGPAHPVPDHRQVPDFSAKGR